MARYSWILAACLCLSPLRVAAQQTDSAKALDETQKLGQRIFQQRCGVCHTAPAPAFPMYGPGLYKDLVDGNEDAIKEMIRTGTSKMPGFKLGLQPPEVDAIVEYLKTVPKPPKSTAPRNAPAGPTD
jgi:mono/diheme cytochrome c family protein